METAELGRMGAPGAASERHSPSPEPWALLCLRAHSPSPPRHLVGQDPQYFFSKWYPGGQALLFLYFAFCSMVG